MTERDDQAADTPRDEEQAPEGATPAASDEPAGTPPAPADAPGPAAPAVPPAPAPRIGVADERPEVALEVPRRSLKAQTRRDFLIVAAGFAATAVAAWWLAPDPTRGRLVGMAKPDRLDTLAGRAGLLRAR